MNIKYPLVRTGLATALACMPMIAMAATQNPFNGTGGAVDSVGKVQSAAGLGSNTPPALTTIVGNVINVALGFLGILLLGYMLYAGFLWMTSGGSDEKAEQATTMIKNSVIGLFIIVAAFSISNFVLNSLVNVSSGT